MKVILILGDESNKFENLYKKVNKKKTKDILWERIKCDTEFKIDNIFAVSGGCFYHNNNLYLKKCSFKNVTNISNNGKDIIDSIKKRINEICIDKKVSSIYIDIIKNGINSTLLTMFSKKYKTKDADVSGVYFYNFGKSYILNKTFFENGYSLFYNNIDHEAINSFKADNGERYFYLCKNGKLTDYIVENKMPNNYIDFSKVELINYSKISEGDISRFVILQRIKGLDIYKTAFETKRKKEDYTEIEYFGINIFDIFKDNYYVGSRDGDRNIEDIASTNDPLVTFVLGTNGEVIKPQNDYEATFDLNDEYFSNLSKSSCRQFVIEGTKLFEGLKNLIDKNTWIAEEVDTLNEYINSDDFENDYEEDYLFKIINKTDKETYYSILLTYVFSKSIDILQNYCNEVIDGFPKIKQVIDVYNEKYNIDLCIKLIDENDKIHLIVIENKINALLTEEGSKKVEDFFKSKDKPEAKRIKAALDRQCDNNKRANQLTKYYQIANVIASLEKIEANNLHFLILAPTYKTDYYDDEKNKFNFGDKYKVCSYNVLREVIDATLGDVNSDVHSLESDAKDVVNQLYRSIWPYISNSCTYYKRTISNKFARRTKKIHNEITNSN